MHPISAAGNLSLKRYTGDLLTLSISLSLRHPWFQHQTDQACRSRGSKQWHVCFISWL